MSDQTERILQKAVADTLKAVETKPTAENIRNWKEAEKALEEFRAQQIAEVDPAGQRFKGIPSAVAYLQERGWKISTSTAYNHRDQYKFPQPKDDHYLAADLDRYAAEHLGRADGSDQDGEEQESQREKARAAADKEREQADNWRIRNQILRGEYVPKAQVEQEFAARAAWLKSDLINMWEVHALDLVEVLGGDSAKVPELLQFGRQMVEAWLGRYAQPIDYPKPKAPEASE